MTTAEIVQPSTTQIIAAFAGALLPLAGPAGIAGAALIPAVEQWLETLRGEPDKNYTVDELAAIVSKGNDALAQLTAHVNAIADLTRLAS